MVIRKFIWFAIVGSIGAFQAKACPLCKEAYFSASENAPKASVLHPAAKVVTYDLTVSQKLLSPGGNPVQVLTINGGIPGPVLRFREGDVARITLTNALANESTSLHWHGLLVPNLEDGVPGVTTPLILPGKSRTFEFLIRQHGTYWYHSHTAHQKQRGVYGAIVVEPRATPIPSVNDHVVLLSDWTDEAPEEIQRSLLRGTDWYAFRKGTMQSLMGAYEAGALGEYLDREKALVPPMDLSDVAYDAFLMNGLRKLRLPGAPGDRLRIRLINAAAATYFYLDSAAGPMKIVAADGKDVVPFDQKRLLIGPAETYDLIITIPSAGAWELRATSQDGHGSVSASLGDGEPHAATPPPPPDRYGMNGYLTSILDQLDPDPDSPEAARPISPYAKLRSATPHAIAESHRKLTLKLAGDMIRYEWSFDGLAPEAAESIKLKENETLRLRLVNNTMMHHPIHFHGHFFRLVSEDDPDPATSPLKHTVDVPPMSVRTIEFTANEGQGDWLLHCHLLYHHITGMVRTIRVTAADGSEPTHPAGSHAMPSTYAWGQANVTTAATTGFATVQSGRTNANIRWEAGMDAHDGREYEVTLSHYNDTRLSLLAGYRLSSMHGGQDGFFAGALFRLPYFVELGLTHQVGGDLRASLTKSLQLTDRLALDLSHRVGRKTGVSASADLRFLLSKQFSLVAGYSSDFGAGAGLIFRF